MPRPDRVRLVVLFGGQSAEHEVSCVSAFHVLRAVDQDRYDLEAVGITREGDWVRADDAIAALRRGAGELPPHRAAVERLEATGTAIEPLPAVTPAIGDDLPVVVLPLLHGTRGEDGTVQGMLELANVPFVGAGVLGSALCMDKLKAKDVLAAHGLPQVPWLGLRDTEADRRHAPRRRGRPALPAVREAREPRLVGRREPSAVDEAAVVDAVALAATYDEWIVVEEGADGREIEVAVLGNATPRASVPGEIVPGNEFYDYEDKYLDGAADLVIPADLPAERHRRDPAPRRRGLHHPALRRHGPRRLLLRGGRSGAAHQRGEHDPRLHAHLDVPQAVGRRSAAWRCTRTPCDRAAARPRRAWRPAPS